MSRLAQTTRIPAPGEQERLFAFWLNAVRHGFGNSKATRCAPYRRQFRNAFRYASGQMEYREEFAGTLSWGGDEVIIRDLEVVDWRLSAHGVFEPPFVDETASSRAIRSGAGERLIEALSHVRCDDALVDFKPRGPTELRMEDRWVYRCQWFGDFSDFHGTEHVSKDGVTVLTQRFHGGIIR